MTHRKLKKQIIYCLYLVGFTLIITGVFTLQNAMTPKLEDSNNYVSKTIFEEPLPVVVEQQPEPVESIINPYYDSKVIITKNYYDYSADEETQKNSLIYYDGSYIPSTGLTYKGTTTFDIVSILSGTVQSIKQDDLLGKIIEIKHDNEIVSVYQSLSEILVQENEVISQGQVIGKSGNSNIDVNSGDHLYFELNVHSKIVNPSSYIGKSIDQI